MAASSNELDFWQSISSKPKDRRDWIGRGSGFPYRPRHATKSRPDENGICYRDHHEHLPGTHTYGNAPHDDVEHEIRERLNDESTEIVADGSWPVLSGSSATLPDEGMVPVECNRNKGQERDLSSIENTKTSIDVFNISTKDSESVDSDPSPALCDALIQLTPCSSTRSSAINIGAWTPTELPTATTGDLPTSFSFKDKVPSSDGRYLSGDDMIDYLHQAAWNIASSSDILQHSLLRGSPTSFDTAASISTAQKELKQEQVRIIEDLAEIHSLLRDNMEDMSMGQARYALLYEHETLKNHESDLIERLSGVKQELERLNEFNNHRVHECSDAASWTSLRPGAAFRTRSVDFQDIYNSATYCCQQYHNPNEDRGDGQFVGSLYEAPLHMETEHLRNLEVLAARLELQEYNKQWHRANIVQELDQLAAAQMPRPCDTPEIEQTSEMKRKRRMLVFHFFCVPFNIYPHAHVVEQDDSESLELDMLVTDTNEEKIARLRALKGQLELEGTRWNEDEDDFRAVPHGSASESERVKLIWETISDLRLRVDLELQKLGQDIAHPLL